MRGCFENSSLRTFEAFEPWKMVGRTISDGNGLKISFGPGSDGNTIAAMED